MSDPLHLSPHARHIFGLRREIIAVLALKLLALIALRFLFFDERPEITPTRVEEHLLDSSSLAEDGS
ncbi:cytochrome oxidase putative small subunit CydP [Povalibacter sp.]|uniref:cytochrome oxidase putative small subunit CydP n=1 Tax=Povalibacter sp. TaxID=1962978 RepID=UPI002F41A6CB